MKTQMDTRESGSIEGPGLAVADRKWISPEEFFREVVSVTGKVHSGCNLNCRYCSEECHGPDSAAMPLQTYRRLSDLAIRHSRYPRLGLEFHGGEPLLLPDQWFRRAIEYAAALAKEHGKTLFHPLQTNATLLTPQRIDTLHELGIKFGVSLDGPPHLNDVERGGGAKVVEAVRYMLERGIRVGLIAVMNRVTCNRMPEVMAFFHHDLGLKDFRLLFMNPQGRGGEVEMLTAEQMLAGFRDVFEYMLRHECAIVEGTVAIWVNRFVHGRTNDLIPSCWGHSCVAGIHRVAVDPRGDVYSCGCAIGWPKHRLGNIDTGFDAEYLAAALEDLHKKDRWYVRCFGCAAYRICSQGCTISKRISPEFREAECKFTRMFYTYLHENPDKTRKIHEQLSKVTHGFGPPV